MRSRARRLVIGWIVLVLLAPGVARPASGAEPASLRAVARTGDAAPGGGAFNRFGQEALPVIAPVNASGDIAFFATLSRGASDEGIFLQRRGRILTVARDGDRVPGVGRLSGFGKHPTPALSDNGTVAFAAAVSGGRAVEGIFAWSAGRLRAVATTGSPAPGMPSSVLAGLDVPAINAHGDIIFLATIRRGRESLDAILVSRGGALRKVVAQGDPAPAGGVFAAFGPPAINAGGAVAFAAVVEGKAVPGGIFVASGDHIQMLAGAGEETPIGGIFAKFSERVGLSDAGVVAFHGMLKFAPVEAAIFAVEGGRPRVVSRLGDPAPAGGTITHFGLWPAVGPGGTIAFAASIDAGPSPVAVLLADGSRLAQIVAVGDTLPGGDRIASLTLYPVVSVGSRGHVTFAVAPTATGEGPEGLFAAQPVAAR
jgi:hypothetical protein